MWLFFIIFGVSSVHSLQYPYGHPEQSNSSSQIPSGHSSFVFSPWGGTKAAQVVSPWNQDQNRNYFQHSQPNSDFPKRDMNTIPEFMKSKSSDTGFHFHPRNVTANYFPSSVPLTSLNDHSLGNPNLNFSSGHYPNTSSLHHAHSHSLPHAPHPGQPHPDHRMTQLNNYQRNLIREQQQLNQLNEDIDHQQHQHQHPNHQYPPQRNLNEERIPHTHQYPPPQFPQSFPPSQSYSNLNPNQNLQANMSSSSSGFYFPSSPSSASAASPNTINAYNRFPTAMQQPVQPPLPYLNSNNNYNQQSPPIGSFRDPFNPLNHNQVTPGVGAFGNNNNFQQTQYPSQQPYQPGNLDQNHRFGGAYQPPFPNQLNPIPLFNQTFPFNHDHTQHALQSKENPIHHLQHGQEQMRFNQNLTDRINGPYGNPVPGADLEPVNSRLDKELYQQFQALCIQIRGKRCDNPMPSNVPGQYGPNTNGNLHSPLSPHNPNALHPLDGVYPNPMMVPTFQSGYPNGDYHPPHHHRDLPHSPLFDHRSMNTSRSSPDYNNTKTVSWIKKTFYIILMTKTFERTFS